MGKNNRTGERSKRHTNFRKKELGYYLIITDTEGTERLYFEGLKNTLNKNDKDKINITVIETRTEKLIRTAIKKAHESTNFSEIWIVFDRDQVINFDAIIHDANNKNIKVAWSNPCIEIWFESYFEKMNSSWNDSQKCCRGFSIIYESKTGNEYKKNNKDLYLKLNKYGNENEAILNSKIRYNQHCKITSKPSEMIPSNTVYKLVNEIREKDNNIKKS